MVHHFAHRGDDLVATAAALETHGPQRREGPLDDRVLKNQDRYLQDPFALASAQAHPAEKLEARRPQLILQASQ